MNSFLHALFGACVYHALLPVAFFFVKDIFALKARLESSRKLFARRLWARFYEEYFDRRGGYVGLGCRLGRGMRFPHGFHGVFISRDCSIGDDCVVFQNVTIGANRLRKPGGAPIIGKHVFIGAGAQVIGGCVIGDDVVIGAGATVVHDVAPGMTVVSQPVRLLQRHEAYIDYIV